MKKPLPRLLLTAALVLVPVALAAAAEQRIVDGVYMSGYQDSGRPLEAVFTPTGSGLWDVVFTFTHNGAAHEYAGTAEGRLDGGSLRGEVETENGGRTFTFRVEHQDNGTLRGRHAERRRGREHDTGTLTLRPRG